MDDRREEIREGNRGGRALFTWDSIKSDRQRELYLGNSIHAPVGRWAENKDLYWFTKEKKEEKVSKDDIKKEIEDVKRKEMELMQQTLGLPAELPAKKPKERKPEDAKDRRKLTRNRSRSPVMPSRRESDREYKERSKRSPYERSYERSSYRIGHRTDDSRPRDRYNDRSRDRRRDYY